MLPNGPPDNNTPTTSTWRCSILSSVASAWAAALAPKATIDPRATGNHFLNIIGLPPGEWSAYPDLMEGHARESAVATEMQISHIVITCGVSTAFHSGITHYLLVFLKNMSDNTLKY